MHSASPSAGERPLWLYLGSCEMSVCLLWRVSAVVICGILQSDGGSNSLGEGLSTAAVGEINSRVAFVVWGCESVSAASSAKSGASWRAPPPFAVLRIAACTNWHAASRSLMRRASLYGYSPAMCVHELGL